MLGLYVHYNSDQHSGLPGFTRPDQVYITHTDFKTGSDQLIYGPEYFRRSASRSMVVDQHNSRAFAIHHFLHFSRNPYASFEERKELNDFAVIYYRFGSGRARK